MQEEEFMAADELCAFYHVEYSFIHSLQEYGLIELRTVNEKKVIHTDALPLLEKMIHLHYDLEINLAGIDAINHLLERVQSFQQEIIALRNQLHRYE
jgi:chaperone modulatory protein CbpM